MEFPETEIDLSAGDLLGRAPYPRIAALDPLAAAPWLARLPEYNRQADTAAIATAVREIVPDIERAALMDPFTAAAATRDLGMLLASLKRHGVQPIDAVPEVERVMLCYGQITGMAPRETVLHYTLWNPAGPQQRRFTDDPSEAGLIDAVRLATPGIDTTVALLARARVLPANSAEFVEACDAAAHTLEPLAEAMKVVRARVDPVFFATVLRPYFEPIRLGGRQYSGMAAAPLAVGLIDHLLWSSDCGDPSYREFQAHLMEYALPGGKRLYHATLGRPSLAARFIAECKRAVGPRPLLAAGTVALDALFKVLLSFRSRHTVIARSAYAEPLRRYPVGSAGYSVDTLTSLLQQTKDARQKLLAVA